MQQFSEKVLAAYTEYIFKTSCISRALVKPMTGQNLHITGACASGKPWWKPFRQVDIHKQDFWR